VDVFKLLNQEVKCILFVSSADCAAGSVQVK